MPIIEERGIARKGEIQLSSTFKWERKEAKPYLWLESGNFANLEMAIMGFTTALVYQRQEFESAMQSIGVSIDNNDVAIYGTYMFYNGNPHREKALEYIANITVRNHISLNTQVRRSGSLLYTLHPLDLDKKGYKRVATTYYLQLLGVK